ncbi:T9SS type A sorting domain-containing protein, partial [bacterium]|nr:T9SS type A sorting domain-containing protein [bacterium]
DLNSFISIGTRFDNDGAHRNLYMYETGEQIDNEVDLILTTPDYDGSSGIWLSYGMRNRPADINGDGFHDIIVKEVNANDDGPYRRLTTYYGGADFDTIPDWRVYTPPWHRVYDFISGFDINGDGYDDIFIDANIEDESKRNFVFLGGDPMDTTVAFDFGVNDFECVDGPACIRDVTVLQDVNDDGYDDWGMYYIESGNPEEGQYDGYFIFFGSEEPDLNPDLELEGVHYGSEHAAASITSGDFNGDGIGDIVTGQSNKAISDYGEICFYFGSRWIEGGEPDLMITNRDDGFRGYPNLGYNVGAAGDYNGDGVDDIVVKSYRDEGREELYQLAILTGSKDWIVGVDEHDQPAVYDLTLKTTPNPFNNSVTISYQVPISGEVKLSIYDVQGRLVEQLQDSIAVAGKHKLTWHSQTSGIYLVLLQTETASVVKKVVCLK